MIGAYRVAAAVPQLKVGGVEFNAGVIGKLYIQAAENQAAAVVFPELALTGCSCGDLFDLPLLAEQAEKALLHLASLTAGKKCAMIIGFPLLLHSRLFNAAAVIQNGEIKGAAGKIFPAEFREHCEKRNFRSVNEYDGAAWTIGGKAVPFGSVLLFDAGALTFGVEIGSDLLAVKPPSADLALGGAQVIFNPASYSEGAGSAEFRREVVRSHSSRLLAAYVQAGAGTGESSADVVFGGRALIGYHGRIAAENVPFNRESSLIYADIVPRHLEQLRRSWSSFNDCTAGVPFRHVALEAFPESPDLAFLPLEKHPFVPEDAALRAERCAEVLAIQSAALVRRVAHTHAKRLVIGLSGGLDSTLALLVCVRCCDELKMDRSAILAVTMPGFGTSDRTRENAEELAREFGAELRIIPIAGAVLGHFRDIGHDPENRNVVYENSQARERTQILMDLANGCGGIVVGTGDLSEIALGWSTFNGDQMSMYCVNGSVPKTLVRFVVSAYADTAPEKIASHLKDVVNTPVSPELLPGAQHTEKLIGSYDLHDFFLYNFLKYGESKENLEILAEKAFEGEFGQEEIHRTLELFLSRFFRQQFKRNPMPDGAKTGTVALSPRGEWRMPSDCEIP